MNTEWGRVGNEDGIRDVIANSAGSDFVSGRRLSFSHLTSGFTDNVFRVDASLAEGRTRSYVAKEYLKGWHQKEKRVYEALLQQNDFLGAPQIVGSGDGFIVLEYLDTERFAKISPQDVDLFQSWVVAKHNFFRQHPELTAPFEEDIEVQIKYLVEKPLAMLSSLDVPEVSELKKRVFRNKNFFIDSVRLNSRLPNTLEHGDLEQQNLLVENGVRMRVLDWVNARRGSGLFDINQFFETANDLGANLDVPGKTREIANAVEFDNLDQALTRVRAIMLLNKIHFYGDKYLTGELFSHSKEQTVASLLVKYLTELQGLLGT